MLTVGKCKVMRLNNYFKVHNDFVFHFLFVSAEEDGRLDNTGQPSRDGLRPQQSVSDTEIQTFG